MWLLLLTSCGHRLDFDIGAPFPDKLSELDFETARDVVPFEPQWPLWSNGLDKERWVYLPRGTTVDTSAEEWAWPEGSLFFKTFSFHGDPVETRILRRTADDWEYAAYRWEGADADLLSLDEAVTVLGGNHAIPTEFDCKMCHEPGGGPVGFSPRQLGQQALDDLGDLFDFVPNAQPVQADDAATTDVIGYWLGNCTHCHDGQSGDQHSFDLSPDAALDNTLGVQTDSGATAPGVRIVPGEPESSILFLAVSGEHENDEIKAMPPVGVQVRDAGHVESLRIWIEQL